MCERVNPFNEEKHSQSHMWDKQVIFEKKSVRKKKKEEEAELWACPRKFDKYLS